MMALATLNAKLAQCEQQGWAAGIFPSDTAKHMRFSINFFTSIGLGGLTDRYHTDLQSWLFTNGLKSGQSGHTGESHEFLLTACYWCLPNCGRIRVLIEMAD